MKNFVQEGSTLSLTAPSGGVTSGTAYLIGSIFGVAAVDAAASASFPLQVEGVFDLPKVSAQAWAEGDRIYWDDGNSECTTVATDGVLVGAAAATAANPSSTGTVRLNEGVPDLDEGPQDAIADITTADATDLATSEALATANKAKINAILAALRAAGVIASS